MSRARSFRFVLGALTLCCAAGAARADSVTSSRENGYLRLSFALTGGGAPQAAVSGTVLTIRFPRKSDIDPAALSARMFGLATGARADSDGVTYRFALNETVKLHTSSVGGKTVIDLAPPSFNGVMPDLPPPPPPAPRAVDVNALPLMKMRTGAYAGFTRLVFDWPSSVPYAVFPGAGKITIRFETLARADLSALTRFAPPWVRNAAWRIDGRGTVVELSTDPESGYHDFRDGNKIVLDVLAPRTDASAYVPPGGARPAPVMPGKTPSIAIGNEQARAIMNAANALNPAPAPPPAKPAETAQPAPTPPAPAAPASEPVQTADSQAGANGVILTFHRAGGKSAAVFVRGLTAWIVIEDAFPFDGAALKKSLGTFAAGIDATRGDRLSVLRVGLKAPAIISARNAGGDLKVAIGSILPGNPIAIGFARNQTDPAHNAITTLLPGAHRVVALEDPVAGDTISIIAASPGRTMPAARDYATFSILPSASGLVVQSFSDALSVSAANDRVAITEAGGLALTPPLMPSASSPQSLARGGEGPAYLDMARWQALGGNRPFLEAARALADDTTRGNARQIAEARLRLARFYLANHFASEALGLVNLIQANDPSLSGDTHLSAIRAAAGYMMGRYRDARVQLAGAGFDNDRHGAFWRGLNEAALENWGEAHKAMDQAQGVLARYPAEWRARAAIADARAGLGLGRLEIADAAMARFPSEPVEPAIALEGQLMRARIVAAQNRYASAHGMFAPLLQSGNERIAAEATYYDTVAAMNVGAIKPQQGIDALEQLRYRWRGDGLELMTLRKLSYLYGTRGDYRHGLAVLRAAAANFPDADMGHRAQDEMRATFADLFLRGKAETLQPVAALGLFYDFIDLTPIGADGDEMIRRMADRLTAVDLLGPAADLLKYQIDNRLDGLAKSQVATRLAMLQLLDHKPEDALNTLRATANSALPEDMLHQRMLLESRAMAALKEWDNALDRIAADNADDSNRLRADIAWEAGRWSEAGEAAEKIAAAHAAQGALSASDRQMVMRAAIAWSMINNDTGLDRLRQNYGDAIAKSPDANAFAVLSQRIDMHGVAFRDAAARMASVDTLDAFVRSLKTPPPAQVAAR